MRPQPGSQQRPKALHGVDVDLAEPIAILVPGVFASTMTDGLVAVAETRKSSVDVILIRMDVRAFGDGLLDDRVDGRLLDIGNHPDHDLATTLNHAEDRWLLRLQGAAPAAALHSVAPAFTSLGAHRLGIAFVSGDNVELVELDVAAQDDVGRLRHDAVAQHLGHGLDIALAQIQFVRDLTVRQVHSHEIRAQYPGRDWLMMSGQNGSRQVIEAIPACLAQVSLSVPLAIVMAVADHASATAVQADNAVRPAELTNDFIALCFVEQVRQLDQVHDGSRSLPQRERPTDQLPDQDQHAEILPLTGGSLPARGLFITPEPDKSLHGNAVTRSFEIMAMVTRDPELVFFPGNDSHDLTSALFPAGIHARPVHAII